jgi:hypothetical protein
LTAFRSENSEEFAAISDPILTSYGTPPHQKEREKRKKKKEKKEKKKAGGGDKWRCYIKASSALKYWQIKDNSDLNEKKKHYYAFMICWHGYNYAENNQLWFVIKPPCTQLVQTNYRKIKGFNYVDLNERQKQPLTFMLKTTICS